LAAELRIQGKHSLVDIRFSWCIGNADRTGDGELPGDKSGTGKPSEELKK